MALAAQNLSANVRQNALRQDLCKTADSTGKPSLGQAPRKAEVASPDNTGKPSLGQAPPKAEVASPGNM